MPLSLEFYVILTIVAACVVAAVALPSRKGSARQFFFVGEIEPDLSPEAEEKPMLTVYCERDGELILERTGIPGLSLSGNISLVGELIGFDLKLTERTVAGHGEQVFTKARFKADIFGAERYHISYHCADGNGFTAFTIPVTPGIKTVRALR